MGLLIDPNADHRNKVFAKKLYQNCNKLCILSYICGIIWLAVLCDPQYNKEHTSLTDNALMPGLVRRSFDDVKSIRAYLDLFKTIENDGGTIEPSDFQNIFFQLGFQDVEVQNFTVYDPVTKAPSFGTNVIGIMRGRRSPGAESMVFNVPYFRNNKQRTRRNTAALALTFALAGYFSEQTYWAKDIVFLIADGRLGSLAWIKGHHEVTTHKYVVADRVRHKGGLVQTAVNFVLERNKVCSFSAKFHGINGQIPNLDMVNLVNKFVLSSKQKFSDWEADIWKLVNFIQTQAAGTPTDSHAFFLQYGIQSMTMYGHKGNCEEFERLDKIGKNLEGIFRSLNGIVERLHQSFFFWFLTSPHRVITISLYFPPLALIALPILLKPASIWLAEEDLEIKISIFLTCAVDVLALTFRSLLPRLDRLGFPEVSLNPEKLTQIQLLFLFLQFLLISFLIRRSSILGKSRLVTGLFCTATLQIAISLYCFALFNPSFVIVAGLSYAPISFLLFQLNTESMRKYLPNSTFSFCGFMTLVILIMSYFYPVLTEVIPRFYYESEMYGNLAFDFVLISLLPALFALVVTL